MMNLKNAFLAITLASTVAFQLNAVPAKRGFFDMKNADGTTVRVRLAGDERFHQYFTEDGYPVIEQNGNFYYCDFDNDGGVINSGIKATAPALRDASARAFLSKVEKEGLETRIRERASRVTRKHALQPAVRQLSAPKANASGEDSLAGPPYAQGAGLFPGTSFPAFGDQKGLVVLVEYADVKFRDSYSSDYFERMLNEDGFSDFGATGCAAEYFRENSANAFRPVFDVYGPITLSKNMSYYGGNDGWGNDQHPEMMVIEACQQLDDTVDFSEYDRDGDGYIDNVFVFYAGRGEASGGGSNTVWPHSWDVSAATSTPYYFDGVRLDRYACSNEWEGSRPDGVGTFIHEFSHVMGLPDLYATSYTSSFTPGEWSALDYGPYNNDGMTPPLYSAFERYALGWIDPLPVNSALNATLPPIAENVAGIIKTTKDEEYFLLENRQQTGWDTYIPGHGMLVWHVDYVDNVWSSNRVNNTASHQYVDIEEADGTENEYSRAGDAFPGTSGVTSFTSETKPAMKTWRGTALNYPITEIAEKDGVITFKVLGGAPPMGSLDAFDAENVSEEGFTATWEDNPDYDHLLSVYTKDDGNISYLDGFRMRNVGKVSSYDVTGLEKGQIYYYTVALTNGWETGEPSNEITVCCERLSIDHYAPRATEATEVTGNSFTANWNEMEDAEAYRLTVYRKIPTGSLTDECNFDEGVTSLPAGWEANTDKYYDNEAYCGEAVPSLRLAANLDKITSPQYYDGISSLSFWQRGINPQSGDYIRIMVLCDNLWTELRTVPVETSGKTVTIDDFPDNTERVRIVLYAADENVSVAIDDIKVGHGVTYSDRVEPGYDALEVGAVTSHTVSGLELSTDYYYTVTATDGELESRVSNAIKVRTLDTPGAVAGIGEDGVSIAGGIVRAAGCLIRISTLDGITVASGKDAVAFPGEGVYIVNIPEKNIARKVKVAGNVKRK